MVKGFGRNDRRRNRLDPTPINPNFQKNSNLPSSRTEMTHSAMPPDSVRIDKWLWAVRLYKSRSLAADACRFKAIRMSGQEVKASREVRAGDVIEVQQGDLVRTLRVRGVLDKRIAAKLVPDFLEDLTSPEIYEAERIRRQQRAMAPPIAPLFRPSKKDRRLLERLQAQIQADTPEP